MLKMRNLYKNNFKGYMRKTKNYGQNILSLNQIIHYTRSIMPKRVTSLRVSS